MRAHYNTNQPTREVCPCCGKKGMGVWEQAHADYYTSTANRTRRCRYCRYTQFQSRKISEYGNWKTDVETETSYNGKYRSTK